VPFATPIKNVKKPNNSYGGLALCLSNVQENKKAHISQEKTPTFAKNGEIVLFLP